MARVVMMTEGNEVRVEVSCFCKYNSWVEKAVVIMYPDWRTTGGIRPNQDWSERPSLEEKFLKITDRIQTRYRERGVPVIGMVYKDTLPHNFSPIYNPRNFDCFVTTDFPLTEWDRESQPQQLVKTMAKLNASPGCEFILGGYHGLDCVVDLARVLRSLGYRARPNLLLTNLLGEFLLISHEARRMGAAHDSEERRWDRLLWANQYHRFEVEVECRGPVTYNWAQDGASNCTKSDSQ